MKISLYGIAYPVTSLGPGNRAVIWVCGCKQQCPGCISPEMQNHQAGKEIEVEKLQTHLLELDHPIDGITISGGEPFDQPQALKMLLEGLSQQRPSWNIMVYTGYKITGIRADKTGKAESLKFIDILIDGNYRQDVPSTHPLTGSGNQVIYFLTRRGRDLKPQINALPRDYSNFGIGKGHRHLLIGILKPGVRKEIHGKLQIPVFDSYKGGIHA